MTMPQGAGGLDVNQWLSDNQDVNPPAGGWIGEFTSINNLSSLAGRTQPVIEQHYAEQVGLVRDWDSLIEGFQNLLGNLPEWLSSLQPLLEWIGSTFTEAFQGLLTGVVAIWDWIETNLGEPLFQSIMTFLKWINDNIGLPIVQTIMTFLKWINDNIGLPVTQTLLSLVNQIEPILQWIAETFTETFQGLLTGAVDLFSWIETNIGSPVFQAISEFFAWIETNIGIPLAESLFSLLKWVNDNIGIPLAETLFSLVKDLQPILTWLQDTFGSVLDTFLEPVFDFLKWVWDNFGPAVETFLKPVAQFLEWLWDNFGATVESVLKPVLEFLGTLWENLGASLEPIFDFLGWVWDSFGAAVETFMKPVAEFLKWVWDNFGATVETFLKPIFEFLEWLWNSFGATVDTVLKPLFEGLGWVWQTFGATAQATLIQPAANFLNWVFNDLLEGSAQAVENLLKPIFDFLRGLFILFDVSSLEEMFTTLKSMMDSAGGTLLGWVSALPGPEAILSVIQTFTGSVAQTLEQGLADLVGFVQEIPIIGPIVQSLLGDWTNPLTGTSDNLADLTEWAKQQLTVETIVPAENLYGNIPQELLSLISVSHVGETNPNLITDQSFSSQATLQAGGGWLWDGTTSFSGSGGGSALVLCDGGVKRLFSNLIGIAPNQKIELSAVAKWSKPSSANPTITVGVRGYTGSTVKFTSVVASVTALAGYTNSAAGTYLPASGTTATAESGWVRIKGTYTVPQASDADSIRMFLGVTNGPQATTVWFDESEMRKVSLLPQTLVTDLTSSLGEKLPGTDFNALLDRVAQKSGASLNDVTAAISSFLKSGSPLNGSDIKSGNIASTFISELVQTWTDIYSGVTNGAPAPSASIYWPKKGLQDFSVSMANQGSTIQSVESAINANKAGVASLSSRASQLETSSGKLTTSVKEIQDAIKELQQVAQEAQRDIKELQELASAPAAPVTTPDAPVTTDPTTPVGVTPPSIVSVEDDFERFNLLNGNWQTPYQAYNDGASLGIPNGHDASYTIPATSNTGNISHTFWKGQQSNTEYQRVYVTLGSQSGVSTIAGRHSWTELSGRVKSYQYNVLCRFYGDGSVKFFYRNGGAGEGSVQIGGTFQSPISPTTGTLLQFFCGDKSVSDQRKLFAKVGTAVIGPVYVPSAVMANLGKSWGWGMGYGLTLVNNVVTSLPSASLNIWGAQDQV